MKGCPACGRENSGKARYCGECGARLVAAWRPGAGAVGLAVGGAALLGIFTFVLLRSGRHEEPERVPVEFPAAAVPVKARELPAPAEPALDEPRGCRAGVAYRAGLEEGEGELKAGRPLGAKRAFEAALAACPEDARAGERLSRSQGLLYEDYLASGSRYAESGDWAGAATSYRLALSYRPGDRAAGAGAKQASAKAAAVGASASRSGKAGIEWVSIPGGSFMMGSESGGSDERPRHRVTVGTFQMAKTEVTVAQYKACVDAGACTVPDQGSSCNWGAAGRGDHPVNCVDWHQAKVFAEWAGGRLPSEAEWEYAARSGGRDIEYPWGDEGASCRRAVIYDGSSGCGRSSTWPACSKTAGNTAQGVCDMAGNVWEWTQDWYHVSYRGAPTDGSAWESPTGSHRVFRGGSWLNVAWNARSAFRYYYGPGIRYISLGFRPAR